MRDSLQGVFCVPFKPPNGAKMHRRDLACSLNEFEGVNEKVCTCHIHGKKKNLSLVTSCHAHELFFEKVSKLVKISLGASLLFLEKKTGRQKAKGKPYNYVWPFSFTYEVTVN